jgi:hypothetical protein
MRSEISQPSPHGEIQVLQQVVRCIAVDVVEQTATLPYFPGKAAVNSIPTVAHSGNLVVEEPNNMERNATHNRDAVRETCAAVRVAADLEYGNTDKDPKTTEVADL